MPLRRALTFLVLLLAAVPVGAGVVRTRDGRIYEGDLHFEPDAVKVMLKDGGGAFGLRFTYSDVAAVSLKPPLAGVLSGGSLAGGWTVADVGDLAVAGSAEYAQGTFTLRGEGTQFGGKSDTFTTVYQRLASDGQLIARVASLSASDPKAFAGLIVRNSLYPESRYCMMAVTAGEGVKFYTKHSSDLDHAIVTPGAKFKPPCWLKIVKVGNSVIGSQSTDGRRWEIVGKFDGMEGMRDAYIGLATSSNKADEIATASFDAVRVKIHGMKAEYFADAKFEDLRLTRIDPNIDFNWRDGPPVTSLPENGYTVRWTGTIKAPSTEQYQFQFQGNGAVRVYLNNAIVLDTRHNGITQLVADASYQLRVEYYNSRGLGDAHLLWGPVTGGTGAAVVSTDQLTYDPEPVPGVAADANAAGQGVPLARGVLLTDGTFLPGSPKSADAQTLTLQYRHRESLPIGVDKIARTMFRPLGAGAAKIPAHKNGLLTQAGDFIEGDCVGITNGKVQLSSVVFGLSTYDAITQAAAVVYRDVGTPPAPAGWLVHTTSGAVLRFTSLRGDAADLVGTEPLIGDLRVSIGEIIDITATDVR